MTHHRLLRTAALGLALAAVAAPTASARPSLPVSVPYGALPAKVVDLRSPDARDAARAATAPEVVDLRSPDARDAARAATAPKVVDLRSPDARDAARGYSFPAPPSAHGIATRVPAYSVPAYPAVTPKSSGTDWTKVGIASGGAFALIVLGLGTVLITRRKAAARKSRAAVLSH